MTAPPGVVFTRAAEAAQLLLTLQAAESSFLGFVKAIFPNYKLAPFQLNLIDALDKLEKGTLVNAQGKPVRRLLINMPPRHGKTQFATTLFPVYYMARRPHRLVMSASYNSDLAKTFGRAVKDTAREPIVQQAFRNFALHEEATAANFWKTDQNGAYYSVGMGGTTTGRGANLLIVDDPVKARQEAESMANRNATHSYYSSALLTRKQPEPDGTPPIEIVILTRWHPDDLAGRIMETQDWKDGEWLHIVYEALDPTDTIALWPERFPVEELIKIRRRDPREFASLYQQRPYLDGGNIFKVASFRTYNPSELPPLAATIITADTAFKKTETADYSAILVAGVDHTGLIYLIDLIRKRLDFNELKNAIKTLYAIHRPKGIRGVHIEDKASGQSIIQELRSSTSLPIIPFKPGSMDKVQRSHPTAAILESGIVALPNGAAWVDDFTSELQQFPGRHDDQVDAFNMAIDILNRCQLSAGDALTSDLPTFLRNTNVALDLNFPSLTQPSNKQGTTRNYFDSLPSLTWGE